MHDVKTLSMVLDMFKVLAENEYSLLWDLVEDFTFHGHKVSVKDSKQFKQVIIDGKYVGIGKNTNVTILSEGKTYKGLDYARHILLQEVAA